MELNGKVSTGGKNITHLRFADNIDAIAEEEQELEARVESLDKTCKRYEMEISAKKIKLMSNSANDIKKKIKVKGQKLGTVTVSNTSERLSLMIAKTSGSLKDCTTHCSSYKAEAKHSYLFDQRRNGCTPSSVPYFYMHENRG